MFMLHLRVSSRFKDKTFNDSSGTGSSTWISIQFEEVRSHPFGNQMQTDLLLKCIISVPTVTFAEVTPSTCMEYSSGATQCRANRGEPPACFAIGTSLASHEFDIIKLNIPTSPGFLISVTWSANFPSISFAQMFWKSLHGKDLLNYFCTPWSSPIFSSLWRSAWHEAIHQPARFSTPLGEHSRGVPLSQIWKWNRRRALDGWTWPPRNAKLLFAEV